MEAIHNLIFNTNQLLKSEWKINISLHKKEKYKTYYLCP